MQTSTLHHHQQRSSCLHQQRRSGLSTGRTNHISIANALPTRSTSAQDAASHGMPWNLSVETSHLCMPRGPKLTCGPLMPCRRTEAAAGQQQQRPAGMAHQAAAAGRAPSPCCLPACGPCSCRRRRGRRDHPQVCFPAPYRTRRSRFCCTCCETLASTHTCLAFCQ